MDEAETIFALASGRGRAGVAVVRVSGPEARPALEQLSQRRTPPPRHAVLRRLCDPGSGALLDEALVLFFAAPASFTGEDIVELHLHGGRAVVDGVLDALTRLEGVRPAEPGAFTRRAFEHGKMDLTAAEGLNDLVMAETAAQRSQAMRQMGGALSDLYERWREMLVEARAHLEAEIDFSDEELPDDLTAGLRRRLDVLRGEIANHLADSRRGERLRDGASVVILGPPNVGKSSLLNALARREAAIVAETAGTTRDVIEVQMDLGGYPATLVDTAGMREASNTIEAEGVRRALERAESADLRIVMAEAVDWPATPDSIDSLRSSESLLVLNKADRNDTPPGPVAGEEAVFAISASTGAGLPELLTHMEERIVALCDVGESPAITRARHRESLEDCAAALDRFSAQHDPVLAAEDLRLAARALGRITGRVDVEDVLDVIFSSFCIGK